MKVICRNWNIELSLGVSLTAALFLAGCGAPSSESNAGSQAAHQSHSTSAASPEVNPTPRIPAFFASAAEARPLPSVLDPKQFSNPVVAKAYQFARENPELYAQQPCYCYCDTGYQHRSLLDCFATDHSAG